jgi:ATP-dependent RNA helicase DDX23/PRP28
VAIYHGGKTQNEREACIERFKKSNPSFDRDKHKVLVATDLAGRGLDVEGVRLVVNYGCPKSIETYVHRAGRTGRAGKKGTAVSFLTPADESLFFDLVAYLRTNKEAIPAELESHPAATVKVIPVTHEKDPPKPTGPADTEIKSAHFYHNYYN